MLDLWSYPSSETFLRFAHSEILFAGKHVGDSGEHEIARPAAFVDVLGLTTEYDYFLSFPCSENIQ